MAIPTYAGIGMQHIASRFFFLKEEKDRREPRQNAATGTQSRAEQPPRAQTPVPEL